MHELAVIKNISDIVIKKQKEIGNKKILSVNLLVGEGRLFVPEWVQMLFGMCTEGTAIEGAQIHMETVPATAQCRDCGEIFRFRVHHTEMVCCPSCGGENCENLTGYELMIKNLEVEV